MSEPYLIVSDLHFHNFDAFSSIDKDGINSRLKIQIDEVKRAIKHLKVLGGDTMFNAGDTFHVRGKVETTVLNPVVELFKWISKQGVTVYSIPGNHDLAGKESDIIGNAAQSLAGDMHFMANEVLDLGSHGVVMFPWRSSIDQLKKELEQYADSKTTAIIHAPVNGVIFGIPDHGLDADYLDSLGYHRVFSGHYHNYKCFENDVYSIGAMCHQTWSDVDSKAGYIIVDDDKVKWFASHAPRFVDIYGDMTDEELLICDGNYVRARVGKATPTDISNIRKELTDLGAKGVIIQAIKQSEIKERDPNQAIPKSLTLEDSVAKFIGDRFGGNKALNALCSDILADIEEVE